MPTISYVNKRGIIEPDKGWQNLRIDRDFLIKIVKTNIERLPLEIIFKNDIIKKENKYYIKPKIFKPNKDTTGNYAFGNVSSWHKSSSYPARHYDFTSKAKFKPKKVGFGKYVTKTGYDNDYHTEIYIPEYIADELVEIDMDSTMENYRNTLMGKGEINAWVSRGGYESIERRDNSIRDCAYGKDKMFDEVKKYFEDNLNKDTIY